MKIIENRIFKILLVVFFSMATFTIGIKIGIDVAWSAINPDYKQNMYSRLVSINLVLESIDNGDIDTAHRLLNDDANGLIYGLDELMSDTEKYQFEEGLSGLLRRISKHRKNNMNRYIEYSEQNEEINQVVLEILKKYEN